MHRKVQTGWFELTRRMRGQAYTGWFFLINTTPALRATPPHLRRGVG